MFFLAYFNLVLFACTLHSGFYWGAGLYAFAGTICWIAFCRPENKK